MAERNLRKIAEESDFHPNDPFAELTRIMGFDPRVADLAQNNQQRQDDDFGIDLERELMGEFEQDLVQLSPDELGVSGQAFDDTAAFSADAVEFDLEGSDLLDEEDFTTALDGVDANARATWDNPGEADAWSASPAGAATPEARSVDAPADTLAVGDDLAVVDMDFADPAPETRSMADDSVLAPAAVTVAPRPLSLEDELSMILAGETVAEEARVPAVPDRVAAPVAIDASPMDESLPDADSRWREVASDLDDVLSHLSDDPVDNDTVEASQAAPASHADEREVGGAGAPVAVALAAAAPLVHDPFAELAALAAAPAPLPVRPRMSLATPFLGARSTPADQAGRIAAEDKAAFALTATGPVMVSQPSDAWPSYARPAEAAPVYEPEDDVAAAPPEPVSIIHDLDIPELDFSEPAVLQAADFDDLDVDQPQALDASAYGQPQAAEPTYDHGHPAGHDAWAGAATTTSDDYAHDLRPVASAAAAGAYATPPAEARRYDGSWNGTDQATQRPVAHDSLDELTAEDFEFDSDAEQDAYFPSEAASGRAPRNRLWIAGLLAGVAILGGVGAYAISFGGGGAIDAPTIVRADPEPVKIRPENPGGATVPNQDNPVYDRVAGAEPSASPAQERLISGAEEPVDVAAAAAPASPSSAAVPALDGDATDIEAIVAADAASTATVPAVGETATALPGVDLSIAAAPDEPVLSAKNEDRVLPADTDTTSSANEDIVAVAPRKVKTMIVRPDGTMVPREETVVAPATPEVPATAAEAAVTAPVVEQPVAAVAAPTPAPVAVAAPVAVETPRQTAVETAQPVQPEAPAPIAEPAVVRAQQEMPARVPVAPPRPADQPVEIVGGVANQQVAAVQPQAPTAAAGGWTMQIASQPTADGAQSTYADLARRYGSVIGGRGVSIVKADIAGKGTFYRVRVPAGSRNEAISLCERYKSAGGSCFVSR